MEKDLELLRSRLPDGVILEIGVVHNAMQKLCPEEQAMVAQAVASRRFEFSTARVLAHKVMLQLGHIEAPLFAHQDRSPAWPEGIVGSLSHSRKHCAALIANQHPQLLGLGVDIEDLRPLKPNLFDQILTPVELDMMQAALPEKQHATHVLTIFGIKEAIFKAMLLLGNHGLGFHAMEIDVLSDPSQPKVKALADLQQRLPLGCLPQVHHLKRNQVLLSVAVLEATKPITS
ncbi:MAG: 4'-phosphopantetheinyl transferase superfamily protein [Planctomycetota bacterium]|nr:4'-phosphopantetheinyl transferase superfamily protein [Planctomycetota bacterium]MDA1113683.1 4'-phosphopantetheinyl transferase superfamily protein [Planctomycetota bacterium]